MTRSAVSAPGTMEEPKLPRRDWILLPGLSLLTIIFLSASTIFTANRLNPTSEIGLQNCFVKASPSSDGGAVPNSVCSERIVESRYVAEYKFNSCGHRAGMECGPKPPGTYRIVMIGSSIAMGLMVPREMTFAALLPAELSRRTGRKVELYNEATGGQFRGGEYPTGSSVGHFDEVLSQDPDIILWIVTPKDIQNLTGSTDSPAPPPDVKDATDRRKSLLVAELEKVGRVIVTGKVLELLRFHWDNTPASEVLQHLLLQNEGQDQYSKSFLNRDAWGYLKTDPSANWQRCLEIFDVYTAEMEHRASAAGVPLVAVLVPDRVQAALLSMGEWPDGYDPYRLDHELRSIVQSHGGTYIDILPDFRTVPNPERGYYPVNGHPDPDGHAMISEFLARELTSGAVSTLKAGGAPPT